MTPPLTEVLRYGASRQRGRNTQQNNVRFLPGTATHGKVNITEFYVNNIDPKIDAE